MLYDRKEDNVVGAYEALAASYDRLTNDVDYEATVAFYQEILKREGVSPRRAVDLACGTGSVAVLLARQGLDVVGVDQSEEMLTVAAQKAQDLAPAPQFVCQSLENLRLARGVDLAVCALDLKRRGKLNGNVLVATVMSNLGLHEFCRNNGIDLLCTDVGDRNVLEKMLSIGGKLGGEQSGHTIFTDLETTGDGEVTALQFLQVLARSGEKASSLVSCCAVYPQVLVNVEVPHSGGVKEAIMASPQLAEAVKREEEALAGAGRVLVRPSGTEALIRVMVEAKTTEKAGEVADRLADFIKSQKNPT